MQALIVANGSAPDSSLIRELADSAEITVAADGGSEAAFAAGVTPDFIVGDHDSLSDHVRDRVPNKALVHDPDPDATDLEKAVRFCLARGCDAITIVGATGGRLDHTLGNLSVLLANRHDADIRMVSDDFEARFVDRSSEISGPPGTVVSLIAFGTCTGVTTEGLRWKLTNHTLPFSPLGVHNELTGEKATVSVDEGDLLLLTGRWVERHA